MISMGEMCNFTILDHDRARTLEVSLTRQARDLWFILYIRDVIVMKRNAESIRNEWKPHEWERMCKVPENDSTANEESVEDSGHTSMANMHFILEMK